MSRNSRAEAKVRQEQQQRLYILTQLVALFLDDIRLRTTGFQSRSDSNGSEAKQTGVTQAEAAAHAAPDLASPPGSETVEPDEMERLLAAVMSAEEEVASQNADLGMLDAISNEIGSTLHLNRVLDAAIKQTQSALKAEAGWCYLFKDGVLVLSKHNGLSPKYVEAMNGKVWCESEQGKGANFIVEFNRVE